jgi:L-arabinose isomerase
MKTYIKLLILRLYSKIIVPICQKVEKSRMANHDRIYKQYIQECIGKHRNKYDYSVMCKKQEKNRRTHQEMLDSKLAKWQWLKRLGS